MTTREDTIKVYLRDCTVALFVGVYDHEKPKSQPVIVTVEATALLTRRFDDLQTSDVSSVIDYERLYDYVVHYLPKLGHIPLLETIAERIIAFSFEDPRINEVCVRLDKPEAFKGRAMVGIEMHRKRKAS